MRQTQSRTVFQTELLIASCYFRLFIPQQLMRGGVESRPAGWGSRSVAVSAASVSTHVWARPRMRSGEVVMRENSVIT